MDREFFMMAYNFLVNNFALIIILKLIKTNYVFRQNKKK